MSLLILDVEKYARVNARRKAERHAAQCAEIGRTRRFTGAEWLALQEAHDFKCLRCGVKSYDLCVDHIVSLNKGGSNGIENIQPLCNSCNVKKRSKTIDYRPVSCLLDRAQVLALVETSKAN